jgi:hypothetical protein
VQIMLLSCEVAMEYLLGLTLSPQVQWLLEHEAAKALLEEIEKERAAVWKVRPRGGGRA